MNSTHMHLNGKLLTSAQGQKNQTYFRGILTKLLHEAFYLEEDFIVAEPEEDCEQRSFIHQFLKMRT